MELESVEDISMFTCDFLNYNKSSDFGYTLLVDIDYLEYLQPLHNDFSFLPKKILINKIKQFHNKRKYRCHIRLLQQALKHRKKYTKPLNLIKAHDLNTKYKAKAKNNFENNQYEFLNNL